MSKERASPPDRGHQPRIALAGGISGLAGEALAWMLRADGNDVIGEHASVEDLLSALELAPCDAAILDVDDDAIGTRSVYELRRAHTELKLLILTTAVTRSVRRCAEDNGVGGVLLKTDSADEALAALHNVLDGRVVLPSGWHADEAPARANPLMLTDREMEVLELLIEGLRNEEIAHRLMISPNTVKFHLRAIYARLGVRNRVEAVQTLARVGGLSSEPEVPIINGRGEYPHPL